MRQLEEGKRDGVREGRVDTVILVVDVITLRLSNSAMHLVDVDPEMHEAKCNVLHGLHGAI